LYEQSWQPEKSAASVAIVHGYAEHSARYAHVAAHLAQHGYAVYAFDLRGHGRSAGRRCFVRSFDEYLADLELFLARVAARAPGKPIFMLGHSMGGAIATLFVIKRRAVLRGLILSGASLKISDDVSPALRRVSAFVGRLFPKLPTIRLDSRAISRDPEVVKSYETDMLVYHGSAPAGTATSFFRAVSDIQAGMELIDLPLLILHGAQDRLADVAGSKRLYARVRSRDKQLKLYDGLYHEILNEPERAQVLADITTWLAARAQPASMTEDDVSWQRR
jgi:alpha-beta hydrolase superfamily lysophospholipase